MRIVLKVTNVLLFLTTAIIIHAQFKPGSFGNGIMPNVLPASPEAGSLAKYGEWPVSQYTGVPSINIPLYQISVSGYQLPITISYHAGGVKLDDLSGWTGSNWSLNAGGIISRTVVGKPDEIQTYGFLYRNQHSQPLASSYNLGTPSDYVYLAQVAKNEIDAEPDIFNYNFGGYSGRFYFDNTGKFQSIPANNLTVIRTPINGLTSSPDEHWEIADPGGNIYYFGSYLNAGNGLEETEVYQENPGLTVPQRTAWYLTKIVLANQVDEIFFDYIDKWEVYDLTDQHSLKILTNSPNGTPGYYDTQCDCPVITSWQQELQLNTVLINGAQNPDGSPNTFRSTGKSQLRKIRWKHGEIVFSAITTRPELWTVSTSKMLDTINVYTKDAVRLKQFKLNYTFSNKRAFLTSLMELDANAANPLTHTFEYESTSSLPERRTSYGQDHWGFYNGAENQYLLPQHSEINNPLLNANREPNESNMKYGILKKITYPTGGSTEFEYEAHRYDPSSPLGGGNPSSTIVQSPVTVKAEDPQPGQYLRTQNFTVPFSQMIQNFSLQFTNYNKPASKNQAWLPTVKIEKLVGGIYQQVYYWDAFDNFPPGPLTPNQYGFIDFTLNQTISLDPGDYRIVTDLVCGVGNCGSPVVKPGVTASFTYSSYNGQLPTAGGLRVKQISNYMNGALAGRKKYLYNPGKLLIYPKYVHQYGEEVFRYTTCIGNPHCSQGCQVDFANYKEITSSSQSILGFTQGSTVGYTFVREMQVAADGSDKGYTDYTYTFTPDVLNSFNYDGSYWSNNLDIQNAAIPANNYEYKCGLPETQATYKKTSSGTYVKIHSINHSYTFNDNDPVKRYNALRGLRVKRLRTVIYPCGSSYNGITIPPDGSVLTADHAYSFYDAITSWVQKASETETTYDENGNNPSTVTTTYTYSNPTHLQVTGISKTDSKGNTASVANKYPGDYTGITATDNTTTGIKLLQQRYIQDKVIESANYYKIGAAAPVLTGATFTIYKPLVPYPDKVQMIESATNLTNFAVSSVAAGAITKDSRFVDQAIFDAYDNNGNILQAHKNYETNTSYIYDHLNSYPVAQVKNAANTVIAYTSFEADGKGYWTYTGTPILDPTGPTGKKVYNLTPSTALSKSGLSSTSFYTISYWTKNASPFTISGTVANFPISGRTVNGWKYYEHKITGQTSVTLSGTGLIDEVRLYPMDAEMTTCTFNPLIGITGQCMPDSRIIYYEYDAFQRLMLQRDQDKNIIKKIGYNYNGQTENNSIYYNDPQSGSATRSCPVGQTGSSVLYTVPSGTYSAYSLAIANALAVADVNANKQAFANATGTCVSDITINGYNSKESDYRLRLTNVSTSAIYNFTLPANTFSPSFLGTVPPGTYTVQFQPNPQPVPSATYSINGFTTSGGSSATFNNISITSTSTASMY